MSMKSRTISFRQLFALLFILFAGLLAAASLQAWTGPSAAAPGADIPTLINIGTTDQVKNAGLSVNAFSSFGSDYIQNKLGVGVAVPVVALDVAGALRIGNGGEACGASLAGALHYNSSSNKIEYCNGTAWAAL